MNKKSYGKSTSKALVIFAVALILALAAFSVYEYMRADSLNLATSKTQVQNDDLTNQIQGLQDDMKSLQQKYDSLQNQYTAMQNQNKSLQDQINAMPTSIGKSNKKVVYLTFDDGPDENLTPTLLNTLNKLNIKATFFISFQNEDTPGKRAILKQEADDGHTLGVHCFNHDYAVCYASESAFLNDFNKMKSIITEVTGITPKINRFPGGSGNTVSMTYSHQYLMPTLAKDVKSMGYKTFDWNAGGEDADKVPPATADAMADKVISDAGSENNIVILLHDTKSISVEAVSQIVNHFKSKGYTFATLTSNSPDEVQAFAKARSGLKSPAESSASPSPSSSTNMES
ncbi:MAG: polysaccharide deacetylase family protein [Eubacteriales bacterium]